VVRQVVLPALAVLALFAVHLSDGRFVESNETFGAGS
jgi:hypothetical protein